MMNTVVALLVLLATGEAPAAHSTVSLVEAQAMVEKLASLERRAKLGKPPRKVPMAVSEAEINSYLNLTRGREMPMGLSDVIVRFERDRLVARGLLDLDQLRGQVSLSEGLGGLLGFLSGKVPVEAGGRLQTIAEGVGAFVIEDAHLATFPVPVTVIERLAVWATKSAENPQGFDIHSPFRLPYALRRVRLQPGRALLD
jgi:hypothetical protein